MSTHKNMQLDFITEQEKIYFCSCNMKHSEALLGSTPVRNSVVKRDDSHDGLAL